MMSLSSQISRGAAACTRKDASVENKSVCSNMSASQLTSPNRQEEMLLMAMLRENNALVDVALASSTAP